MKSYSKVLFTIFMSSFFLFSCHDDYEEQFIADETRIIPVTEFVESNVLGIVSTQNGDPIIQAEVKLAGEIVYTDSDGFFKFNDITSLSSGDLISVTKKDYISNYKIIYPEFNASLNYDIILNSRELTTIHKSNQVGSYDIIGGGNISFPANAIQNDKGEIFNGDVNVYAYWIDAESSNINYEMPGDLSGINIDGQNVQLASYGMFNVELEDESGNPLNIAEGFSSTLKFPLSNKQLTNAPDEIPLWYFDEESGKWKEEGKAIKEGDFYIGEVSHFSFWNCDDSFELIDMKGRILDNSNDPVQGWQVSIFVNSSTIAGTGFTNSNGVFSGKIPANEKLKLVVENCDEIVIEEEIGPFDNDVDLGDFIINRTLYVISGKVITCSPDQNDQVYALYKIDGETKSNLLSVNADGSFIAHVKSCDVSEFSINFINPVDNSFSESIEAQFVNNEAIIGDVQLCGGDGSYITFKSENDSFIVPLDEGGFSIKINEEKYSLKEEFEFDGEDSKLEILVNSIQSGVFNIPKVFLKFTSGQRYITISNALDSEMEIINAGVVGDYYTGTFKNFENTRTNEYYSGTFRVKVNEEFNTGSISGKIWVDEDGNGIRDTNENNFINFPYLGLVDDSYLPLIGGPNQDFIAISNIDDDGSYSFGSLNPNKQYYVILINLISSTVPTLLNEGSDNEIDNDFLLTSALGSEVISTEAIILNDGEILENIDFGILESNSFYFSSNNITPCQNSVTLKFSINGGHPPFSFELSNGESFVGGADFSYETSKPNLITVDVTDSRGTKNSLDLDPKISRNNINGRIWLDSENGEINSYDNVEPLQSNIKIELFDEDGLCETTTSTMSGFQFNRVPRGTAYIKVILPPGHSFVEEGVGSNPSEVNVDGDSMSFDFTGCDENRDILIGIKAN